MAPEKTLVNTALEDIFNIILSSEITAGSLFEEIFFYGKIFKLPLLTPWRLYEVHHH